MPELMNRRAVIPTKSCQSGARPSPLDKAMATSAAASMTQESGFNMKLKNWINDLQLNTQWGRECDELPEGTDFAPLVRACWDQKSHNDAGPPGRRDPGHCIGGA